MNEMNERTASGEKKKRGREKRKPDRKRGVPFNITETDTARENAMRTHTHSLAFHYS